MSNQKKIGTILILLGMLIPVLMFIFSTGYLPKLGFLYSIQNMEIVLRPGTGKTTAAYVFCESPSKLDEKLCQQILKKKIAIPYKYCCALGIIFIFIGSGLVLISSHRNKNE